MPTSAQVLATLSCSNTFDILNLSAPINTGQFTDNSDWASIGITSGAGDTVKIISKVVNPVGANVHLNAGYATDDYTSPDTDLSDLVGPLFTLAVLSGTNYPVWGTYTFYLKCQVTPNGQAAIEVEKTFSITLEQGVIPTLSLTESYNCNNATFTSVDSTNYATPATNYGYSITSIVRTHTVRPPLNSLQSNGSTLQSTVTADAQTILMAANSNPLWTGTYSAAIASVVTYSKDGHYIVVHIPVLTEETNVECDEDLCNLFCCLKGLISSYVNAKLQGNTVKAQEYLAKWDAGDRYLLAIKEAKACSNATLQAEYTTQFYLVTGCDLNCDCGCTDGPAPVVPTTAINGTDGTDGSQILSGTTVPDNADGAVGDYYIRTTNGMLYKKTGPSAWTSLFVMLGTTGATGATGAAGAAGTNGTDGIVILANQFPALATLGTSYESLLVGRVPYSLLAATLANNGDEVNVMAVFTVSADPTSDQKVRLTFNGSSIIESSFYASNFRKIILAARIVRVSNTAVNIVTGVKFYQGDVSGQAFYTEIVFDPAAVAGLNLTTTAYNIDAQADSTVIGDITCQAAQISLGLTS